MRRLLAAAALAALCATAACGSQSGDSPSGSGSTTGAATTGAANPAVGSNTQQVCADAEKVITDSTTKFSQELTKLMTAAATGDKSVSQSTVTSVKELFNQWAKGLREQAGKATDTELKAALGQTADQITIVAAKIKTLDDLQQADKLLDAPEVAEAGKKLEQFCN